MKSNGMRVTCETGPCRVCGFPSSWHDPESKPLGYGLTCGTYRPRTGLGRLLDRLTSRLG